MRGLFGDPQGGVFQTLDLGAHLTQQGLGQCPGPAASDLGSLPLAVASGEPGWRAQWK